MAHCPAHAIPGVTQQRAADIFTRSMTAAKTIVLLILSNVFMTFPP